MPVTSVVYNMPVMKGTTVTDPSAEPKQAAAPTGRSTDDAVPNADRAAELRAALVDSLRADGKITMPAVEAAFRTVARERFLPADVPLEKAYAVDDAVVTKLDEHG